MRFDTKEERNAWFKIYRENNRQAWNSYRRIYNKEWRKKHGYHNEINSRKRYPEKVKCRNKTRYAIRTGVLKKQPCEVCKNCYVQAHHEDYTKPLEVRWFCAKHHAAHEKRASEFK